VRISHSEEYEQMEAQVMQYKRSCDIKEALVSQLQTELQGNYYLCSGTYVYLSNSLYSMYSLRQWFLLLKFALVRLSRSPVWSM